MRTEQKFEKIKLPWEKQKLQLLRNNNINFISELSAKIYSHQNKMKTWSVIMDTLRYKLRKLINVYTQRFNTFIYNKLYRMSLQRAVVFTLLHAIASNVLLHKLIWYPILTLQPSNFEIHNLVMFSNYINQTDTYKLRNINKKILSTA